MMPSTDWAFSGLITDMADRGLLEETLVCFVTEFGRTPKINERQGRDHWVHAFSMVFAGAGVPGGQIVGETDPNGWLYHQLYGLHCRRLRCHCICQAGD